MTSSPVTIFVLDDDSSVRTALARLIRARGFAVEQLHDFGALDAALPLPAQSCLLVDIALGRESGFDVRSRLAGRNKMAPVVFMTATDDDEELARADTAGAVRCLRKPVEADDLFRALDAAVFATRRVPVLNVNEE